MSWLRRFPCPLVCSSLSTSTTSARRSRSTPGCSAPSRKVRPGYANFAIAEPPLKLVLLENPGQGGSLNHLGVEVPDTGTVEAEQARLAGAGLAAAEERETTCCYARQDKFWVQGAPDGEAWEIYTVLADSPTFWGADGSQAQDPAAGLEAQNTGQCCAAATASADSCC